MRNYSDTVWVDLNEVHIPEKTWKRIMRKDHGQIAEMQADFESERDIVRVVLRTRFGGGYNVEDGRHRVIAAKLAGVSHIEAIIIGSID